MENAAPKKFPTGDDDDDDDDDDGDDDGGDDVDDDGDKKFVTKKKLKIGNERNKFFSNAELLENVQTVTANNVELPEVSSNAAEESGNYDNSRIISQGSNFIRKGRKSVFLTFRARQRPRQPFMNQEPNQGASAPPRPPPYYTAGVNPEQHRPEILRRNSERRSSSERVSRGGSQPQTTQPQPNQNILSSNLPRYQPGELAPIPNHFFFNYSYWAPYPDNVPSSVLPCLAHLYKADSLFIIQQINIFDLMFSGYFDVPNLYFIQNKAGQVIYYVYETRSLCFNSCCGDSRGFQLHVMDMYNNEIIYMNRPCGCTNAPCCYPVMEVYSPPLVPVGAITQVCNGRKLEFAVIDADENLIFKIHGPLGLNFCCCCLEVDFTIHALDKEETEIGVIRREWGGFVRTFLAESDMYGITFPEDLDVRIKAVFLGALFFIEYLYFESS